MVKPIIGITLGDPSGIGPEIIAKAIFTRQNEIEDCIPIVLGDRNVLEKVKELLSIKGEIVYVKYPFPDKKLFNCLYLLPISLLDYEEISFGYPNKKGARYTIKYIKEGVKLALEKKIDAIVTAPINKKVLSEVGFEFPGHTEFLAHLTKSSRWVMMLAGDKLKVSLVTIHLAIKDVSNYLSIEKVINTIELTSFSLRKYFGISRPKIAVAGLNPHAGEEGMFGKEEENIIRPAIFICKKRGIDCYGPLSADTLFYFAINGRYDAVVAMYHDQGLIPLKMVHFRDGVNITLGLPIIRTSVDHGTAYDIAGKGEADESSMIAAINMAVKMVKKSKTSCD